MPADTQALSDAIENAVSKLGRGSVAAPRNSTVIVRRSAQDAAPLVLDVIALPHHRFGFTFVPRVLVLLRGEGVNAANERRTAILRSVYGMTAAETEIALELLAGKSPEEIATGRTASVATVRTQIKSDADEGRRPSPDRAGRAGSGASERLFTEHVTRLRLTPRWVCERDPGADTLRATLLARRSYPMRSRVGVVVSLILATQLAGCGGGGSGDSAPPVSNTPPPSSNNDPAPPPAAAAAGAAARESQPEAERRRHRCADSERRRHGDRGHADLHDDGRSGRRLLARHRSRGKSRGDFVTLSGKGVGAQSYIEFRSIAGSFQTLAAAAGSDKTLSSEENHSTQITNVSTAEAVLLQEANGGQPITSDSALADLGGVLDGQQVLDLAATLKLLVDHAQDYPMPVGETSILALATNTEARQKLIEEVAAKDPAVFAQMQTAIAADPSLSRPLVAADVQDFTSAMLSGDPGFSFNYTNRAANYTFEADGSGSVSTGTSDASMKWKIEGSNIRVTFDEPVQTVSFDTENCAGDVRQVEAHYETKELTLAFLSKRTVATTEFSHVTYADCPSLAARDVSPTSARTILTEDDAQPIELAELRDSTHSIYVYNSPTHTVMADIADLDANGTGTTRLLNQTFTWELDDTGRVVEATFGNGTTAEYRVLREIDAVTSDLFFELRTPTGAVYTDIGASVYADPDYSVDFSADLVPGRYYQFGKGDETGTDDRLKGFALRFDTGGAGSQEVDYVDLNGDVALDDQTTSPNYAFHWTLENGDVVVRRTWDPVAQLDACVPGAANCEVYDERRIVPIAADDNRIYWLEKRRSGDGRDQFRARRPRTWCASMIASR